MTDDQGEPHAGNRKTPVESELTFLNFAAKDLHRDRSLAVGNPGQNSEENGGRPESALANLRSKYQPPDPPPVSVSKPVETPVSHLLFFFASIVGFDLLLFPDWGGTGYAIATVLCALGFRKLAGGDAARTRLLMILLCCVAIRNVWDAGLLSVLLAPVLICIIACVAFTRIDHWLDALIMGCVSHPLGVPRSFSYLLGILRVLRRKRTGRFLAGWTGPVIAAALVLFVFGQIFIYANPVVEHAWSRLCALLSLDALIRQLLDLLFPRVSRVALWVFTAVTTAAWLAPLSFMSAWFQQEDQTPTRDSADVEMSGRTALFALGAACLIFAAYVALDATYLVIRAELPAGITDSDYARRGTFWLTFALLLSTLCIAIATAQSQLASRWNRTVSGLAHLWVWLDLLMACCVLGRIRFYIVQSGLTPLRITGIFGTLTVVAGIVLMGIKVASRMNLYWLVRRYVVVFIVGLTIFTVLPRDSICSWYNVSRASAGDTRPLILLFRSDLPFEGLTEYVALMKHRDPVIAQGIAAYLAERQNAALSERRAMLAGNWRSYQAARARAHRALDAVLDTSGSNLYVDEAALTALARACGGTDRDAAGNESVVRAWSTGQRSNLEWIDD